MGLLKQEKESEIDGINHEIFYFQKKRYKIFHMPQEIYLADSNIAENMFKAPSNLINRKKLGYAIKASDLSDLALIQIKHFKYKLGKEETKGRTRQIWNCKSNI